TYFHTSASPEFYTLSLHDALPICVWENAEGSRSIRAAEEALPQAVAPELFPLAGSSWIDVPVQAFAGISPTVKLQRGVSQPYRRSEEHTSELQSRFDLVCRLLLEK